MGAAPISTKLEVVQKISDVFMGVDIYELVQIQIIIRVSEVDV